MLDTEEKVQGVGVYVEFRQPGQTLQMFVTPDAYTNNGQLVPMSLHRRIVTPTTLKGPWKRVALESPEVLKLVASGNKILDKDIEAIIESRMKYGAPLLDEAVNKGWAAVEKPFVFEVSTYDADDLAADKTPNKILYRITLCRTALGYPAELT
jgi:hypothetical protein